MEVLGNFVNTIWKIFNTVFLIALIYILSIIIGGIRTHDLLHSRQASYR